MIGYEVHHYRPAFQNQPMALVFLRDPDAQAAAVSININGTVASLLGAVSYIFEPVLRTP